MNWFIKKILSTLSRNDVSYNKTREDAKRDYYELGIPKEPKMPTPKPPAWFAHWNKGFDQWKDKVDSRLESLETKVDNNSKAIQRLETKVDENSKAIQRLENGMASIEIKVDENSKNIKKILDCPTIQQEIQ